MNYNIYLQVRRDGRTHAHVPDLIGCNWTAANPQQAWECAGQEIRAYLDWLRRHNLPAPPPDDEVTPWIAQERPSRGLEGHLVGFFESDHQPVTRAEMERLFTLMECSRADLLALTQDLPEEILNRQPAPDEWSIRQILRHVAGAEQWYLTRIYGSRTLPRLKPARTVWERLAVVRALALERLAALSEAQRSEEVIRDGELWTARKVFRRFLEHEREHYNHVLKVLASFGLRA